MNKKFYKILITILSLVVVFSTSIVAYAIEVPDLNRSGSISVTFEHEGKAGTDGTLTMYKVGDVHIENGADYSFVLTKAFADAGVPLDDLESQAVIEDLDAFVEENEPKGTTEDIKNGVVEFTDVEPGLYLMVQEKACKGFYAIDSFLVSLPQGDENGWVYQIDATPKMQTDMKTLPPDEYTIDEGPDEDGILPNTGQLKWPIPVLAISGMVLFALGYALCFLKGKKNA